MGKQSREKKERQDIIAQPESVSDGIRSKSLLWKLIFVGTCFIIFVPFIINANYFFPFVGLKSVYFMALVEIIFAAWIIMIISKPQYRPNRNAILLALALFLIAQIISSLLGVDPSRSFWSKFERMTGLLMQFHLFAFFLVVSSTFKKKSNWLAIFSVSSIAAVIMSLINLGSQAGMDLLGSISSATRGGGTIGNSSFLGTYLLFNFFITLYLIFNSKKSKRFFAIAALLVIGTALLFSTARAAFLSTFGGLVLLFLLWMIFGEKKDRLRKTGIVLSVFIIIVLCVVSFLIVRPGNQLHNYVFDGFLANNFGGRFVVWEGAWQGFLEKPIFGWGPENFEIVFTKYFNPCLLGPNCGGDIWYDRAHNIIFDTLVTTGTVGFICYLLIFVAVFFILWKKFRKGEIDFWTAGIFSVCFVAYFVQNLTVFDMVNSYMLFFLVLGFVASLDAKESSASSNREKPVNSGMALLVLLFFAFPFFNFVVRSAQASAEVITALSHSLGTQERLESYQKTLKLSPLGKYQIRDFFSQSTSEDLESATSNVSLEGLEKEMSFIVSELEKSIKESPLDFRSYLKLGQFYDYFYVVSKDVFSLSRAEEVLNKAISISPTNQQGYWALAQTKIYQNKLDEAFSLSEKALNLDPESSQSNLIIIQVAKFMGDEELVQQKVDEALKINPSWETSINDILSR